MPDLLLLHGALGAADQFDPLVPLLEPTFTLHRIDFEGHGFASMPERPYRIESFAENVLAYLDERSIDRIDIFGYSMGGYVALYLASIHPERVGRIATLGTKFRWDPETSAREVKNLDAGKIAEKVPRFAEMLRARHSGPGWERVLEATAEMMISLGERPVLTDDALSSLEHAVRLGVGDRDVTVSVEETTGIFRLLKNGELEVFAFTPHPFERAPHLKLARSIEEFVVRGS